MGERNDLLNIWSSGNNNVRVLTNNNRGTFLLEETPNTVREAFVPGSRLRSAQNSISPAITEKPRSWPSALRKTNTEVSVIQTGKNGRLEQEAVALTESTTFSSSQVRIASSTTPVPKTLKQMMRMMEQKMLQEAKSDLSDLKIGKSDKILAAIRRKVAEHERLTKEDVIVRNRGESSNSVDLQNTPSDLEHGFLKETEEGHTGETKKIARLRSRRKKLNLRAKALAKALGDIPEAEPYVVFPMDDINTKEKTVDEIFNTNPGLKRISAYDFEAAMAIKEGENRPMAELKISIDDLAQTMNKLSNKVHETTTKKDTSASDEKISQLQEEIAKLTRTLASLQISPPSVPQNRRMSTRRNDLETAGSQGHLRTWLSKGDWEISDSEDDGEMEGSEERDWMMEDINGIREMGYTEKDTLDVPEKLEIFEVNTVPTTTVTTTVTTTTTSTTTATTTVTTTATTTRRADEERRVRHRSTHRPRAPTLSPIKLAPRTLAPLTLPPLTRSPIFPRLTLAPVSPADRRFPMQNSVDSLLEVSTKKHPTNREELSNFFGNTKEEDFGKLLTSSGNKNSLRRHHPTTRHPDLDEALNHPEGGVLGLFQMMGKMHTEARDNFAVVELPTQEQEEERFMKMQEQLRQEQVNRLREDEAVLREEQRKKLELFSMIQEQEAKEKEEIRRKQEKARQEELRRRQEEMKRLMLEEQRLHTSGTSWRSGTPVTLAPAPVPSRPDSPGVAVASITIENVANSRDYEINDNGIVRLRKGGAVTSPSPHPDYEYEYYEANPDDIQFPVGATRQFFEAQNMQEAGEAGGATAGLPETGPTQDVLSHLSNKELLMNLLQASNNFQNRDFLDRLKTIVTGVEEDANKEKAQGGSGLVTLLESSGSKQTLDMTPWSLPHKNNLETSRNPVKDDLPVWPSGNSFLSQTKQGNVLNLASEDQFQPLPSQIRFPPNRRMDPGMGEVSLVTGEERKKATSLAGFGLAPVQDASQSSYTPGHSRISDRLDTTSDQEFVVSTSMAMKRGSQAIPPAGQGTVTLFDADTGFSSGKSSYSTFGNSGYSFGGLGSSATSGYSPGSSGSSGYSSMSSSYSPGSSGSSGYSSRSSSYSPGSSGSSGSSAYSSSNTGYGSGSSGYSSGSSGYGSGTVTPVIKSSQPGREVFRLGSGVQLQQPEGTQVAASQNYILPTYSNTQYGLGEGRGEIYTDIRLEPGKKNLLTLPTDPNKMYIKSQQDEPKTEVILYPAGQLLSHRDSQSAILDPMLVSGSADSLMTQEIRDQMPGYGLNSANGGVDRDNQLFDVKDEMSEQPPAGFLETLLRTAKDDLKFGGQVLDFLQANGR